MLVFGPENNWLKLLLTFCLLSMFDKNVAANSMNDKWLEPNEYLFGHVIRCPSSFLEREITIF
jgi:hypothetical protein